MRKLTVVARVPLLSLSICSWLAACITACVTACNGAPAAQPGPAPAAQPVAPAPGALTAPVTEGAHAGAAHAGGLTWKDSAPLVRRTPKSSMRAAEYGLQSDPSAELTVFYFGAGQGGSVDANITRWLGQLTQPDGSDTASNAKREQIKVGALPVTLIEAQGTYTGMAMGGPAPGPQTDAMLLGAIAEGPQGPVFFKLVGARGSVETARGGFRALVDSLRVDAAH